MSVCLTPGRFDSSSVKTSNSYEFAGQSFEKMLKTMRTTIMIGIYESNLVTRDFMQKMSGILSSLKRGLVRAKKIQGMIVMPDCGQQLREIGFLPRNYM